jgi:hypothetical protein
MSLMHGKLGRIEWDCDAARQNLELGQSWTCDVSHDVAEITSMGATWRTYLGGYRDWTATVECLEDAAGADITLGPGDPNGFADVEAYLELYFMYDTTNTKYRMIYGKAICNGIAEGADAQGIPTVTYSFQGVDQLTWYSSDAALKTY